MDEWEGLFGIWHGRQHAEGPLKEKLALWDRLKDLERRIVLLEAYIQAKRAQEAESARLATPGKSDAQFGVW